jgi:hypothetical protein
MDGSTIGPIIITVVVVISLAAWPIVVAYAARHPASKLTPSLATAGLSAATGAGPGGFAGPEIAMSGRRRKELVAANADLILASELSAHAYAIHFEAQMRGGKVRQLLHARPLGHGRSLRP